MKEFILIEGKKIVTHEENLKDPKLFTTALLGFKKQIDNLIDYSFRNDILMQKARDSSF